MKCRYCGHDLRDPELCPEGEQLWCRVAQSEKFLPEYEDYCRHIASCEECQRKLGLSDIEIEILRQTFGEAIKDGK